ncbi:lipopolysaccharide biosynthesis protein [Sphingobacterium kitahiroshimense]|uniref:Lipopolysaccharide biosynthesis protein n=1 Tax=Sphingobacterium kitahiroshimense TaxID=470446 RepID=A0ABV0C1Q0_9SPHI
MNELNNPKEISLKELILKIQELYRYLFSKWYIIMLVGLLGGALGYFYAVRKEPLFTATTTFVLETGEKNGGMGEMAGLAALAGLDLSGGGNNLFQGDNLFALYKSRTMLEQALLSPNPSDPKELLINLYIRFNKIALKNEKVPNQAIIDFKQDPKLLDRTSLRQRDSLLSKFTQAIVNNNLTVEKADKKSTIIKVEIKSHNEDFSKSFNEVLVNAVNNFYINTKTKKSLNNIAILQHKTDSVRSVLNGSISAAAYAVDVTPNLNPTRQAQRIVPVQRSQVSSETNKAILSQLVQNLELSKMNLMKEAPLIEKVDQPIYPLPMSKFGKAKGIILGTILFTFCAITFLCLRKLYIQILR